MDDDTRARATANQSKDAAARRALARGPEETLRVARAQGRSARRRGGARGGRDRVSAKKKASVRNTAVTTVLTALQIPRTDRNSSPATRAPSAPTSRASCASSARRAVLRGVRSAPRRLAERASLVAETPNASSLSVGPKPAIEPVASQTCTVVVEGYVRGCALSPTSSRTCPGSRDFPLARVEAWSRRRAAPAEPPPKGAIADLRMRRWTPGRARRSPCPRRARSARCARTSRTRWPASRPGPRRRRWRRRRRGGGPQEAQGVVRLPGGVDPRRRDRRRRRRRERRRRRGHRHGRRRRRARRVSDGGSLRRRGVGAHRRRRGRVRERRRRGDAAQS